MTIDRWFSFSITEQPLSRGSCFGLECFVDRKGRILSVTSTLAVLLLGHLHEHIHRRLVPFPHGRPALM